LTDRTDFRGLIWGFIRAHSLYPRYPRSDSPLDLEKCPDFSRQPLKSTLAKLHQRT